MQIGAIKLIVYTFVCNAVVGSSSQAPPHVEEPGSSTCGGANNSSTLAKFAKS